QLPTSTRLVRVGQQSHVVFCLESSTDADNVTSIGSGEPMALQQHIESLRELHFEVTMFAKSILIKTPGASALKDNPLNTLINGFSFKCNHPDFLAKLGALFPYMPPGCLELSGSVNSDIQYDIDIKRTVTIREILMEISSDYGVAWNVDIKPKAPDMV